MGDRDTRSNRCQAGSKCTRRVALYHQQVRTLPQHLRSPGEHLFNVAVGLLLTGAVESNAGEFPETESSGLKVGMLTGQDQRRPKPA
jgi:hypothetical protein